MRVAFYAPLNDPDSPVPSGDRQLARTILQALRLAGHDVRHACRFSALDLPGDATRIARLEDIGHRLAARVLRHLTALPAAARPEVWLTYHLYHKAPDWIGPHVAKSLGIPYVVVEASYAKKQQDGPWHRGLAQVAHALATADLVVGFKRADEAAVRPWLRKGARYVDCAPFLDTSPFSAALQQRDQLRARLAAELQLDASVPWLLTVGMMRPGPKLLCYEVLARAIAQLRSGGWQLLVSGDGPEAATVRAAFAAADPDRRWSHRVRWLGCRQAAELAALYAACDLFLWPAVKEPIGMVFVEAQAAGLPIVAGDRPGVREVARPDVTCLLTPEGDAAAFATAVDSLLADDGRRSTMRTAGAAHAVQAHDVTTAGRTFVGHIAAILRDRAASTTAS